jgi:hypothetical protein
MFRTILFTQLRWTRLLVVGMAVVSFLVPAIAWWLGGMSAQYPERPGAIIIGFQSVGGMLMLVAGLGAFFVAAYPWMMDAASRHVFALSLPIRWREYLAMRFGAGALTLLLPALTLYLGSLFALSMLELPATLRAYPGTLALRFLAASLLAYSLTFAVQYIAGRRAALVIVGVVVGGAVLSFGLRMFGLGGALDGLVSAIFDFPGPFAVFTAEWKLVDV